MYKYRVQIEKDGRQVGAAELSLDEAKYRDARRALEALGQFGEDVANEALNEAYAAAGVDQFPQGGGEDRDSREPAAGNENGGAAPA